MTSILLAVKIPLLALLTSLVSLVNPFVGTDFHGHTFPGAAYPFGMVQLSPDTRPDSGNWDGCSGYHYSDSLIYGFSHTHLSGTGCDDLCDILVMPVRGFDAPAGRKDYASAFSHASEKASPGYYEVKLERYDVTAKLSAGRRAGFHEYIFAPGSAPQIVIDLKPALSEQQLDARVLRDFSENNNRNFINALNFLLPKKLVPVIVSLSGIPMDTKVNSVTREQRAKLVYLLKHFTVTVTDFRPIEEAVVTSGGVKTSEIDPKTMQSKLIDGLYFAGEVIDVDAYTGGFNLQIAFSTGHLAGESAAQ